MTETDKTKWCIPVPNSLDIALKRAAKELKARYLRLEKIQDGSIDLEQRILDDFKQA